MAMAVAQGGGGRRGSRRGCKKAISEINVTPMVDVMLVLLIVFMVTAPLLTVGVPVDLPQTRAQNIQTKEEPLTISVDSSGQVFVQKQQVAMENLVPMLTAIAKAQASAPGAGPANENRIFVRGE